MRILYHHRTLGDGAEGIHIREMVKAFRRLGHEVRVIGPTGELPPGKTRKTSILGSIKRMTPSFLFELMELAYSGYAFAKTAREIRKFRPDFIYDRYITFNAGTVLAGMAFRVPVCLEVNAPLALERSGEQDEKLVFRGMASAMERWICSRATRTLVVSTPLKTYLESIGVPRDKCYVMPNGVDHEKFTPREKSQDLLRKLEIDPACFVVGFTGVLRPWHGIDLLLDSLASLAQQKMKIFLLIVGDGPYRQQLEDKVSALNLGDFVRITGRIPHEQVPVYVSLFDVAVSPRATFYASPMKVMEYMALGKPVVVPRTPNFLDFIDERVNGVTFEDGNSTALEEAIAFLYRSRDLCAQLGVQARRKVEDRLNWEWNARRSCELMTPVPGPGSAA
jgi:glycosyltransferase involved in cell wall biosynthesis